VVVLDEISQTPTDQVQAVLAAVDACPGGQVWVLGDARQSQPVGPGGAADHLESLADAGVIPSARLTVNRRQVDACDRRALDLLRRGKPVESQQVRTEQGWEHEHVSPAETRQAMAQTVCEDIVRFGADQVAALVVSHGDAEDLADRVRAQLVHAGQLSGPSITGPGWTTDREYRAGDRVLLHARCGRSGSLLVNGTTATVTGVGRDGLKVRLERRAEAVLPMAFVGGTRKDGSPNLSHAWARTVDGAQGGTWEACHLLGSCALDAYRGYTGQSRSRQPTHTWNTTRIGVVDHGGILADQRDGAEQVADALARRPDPTLAARSDPWILDRQLHQLIADHERVLAGRPSDCRDVLARAIGELDGARTGLAQLEAAAAASSGEVDALGPLTGLGRHGRDQRRSLQDKLDAQTRHVAAMHRRCDEIAGQVEPLKRQQNVYDRFESTSAWRRDEIVRLGAELDRHWAEVVTKCVQADDPLAYGIDKLRHALATVEVARRAIDAGIPDDRTEQWQQARRQLPDLVRQRHEAEQLLEGSRARLEDAGRRRWGRHDNEAIVNAREDVAACQHRAELAGAAELGLRERVAHLAEHEQRRHEVMADLAPQRKQLGLRLAQIDAALERTRPDRIAAIADNPPEHLVSRIGPAPRTPAGRAVWCHHALDIETAVDRSDGRSPGWSGQSQQAREARRQIAVADRVLRVATDRLRPSEWAELAQQAGAVLDQARRAERIRNTGQTVSQWQRPRPTPWIDAEAGRREPGVSL
jgi:hypothetical protein